MRKMIVKCIEGRKAMLEGRGGDPDIIGRDWCPLLSELM